MKESEDNRVQLRPLVMALGVTAAVVFIFLLLKNTGIFTALSVLFKSLQAFFFSIIFAYVMNPIARFYERHLRKRLSTSEKNRDNLCRILGIVGSLLTVVCIILVLLLAIVPQLVSTSQELLTSFDSMTKSLEKWLKGLSSGEKWQNEIYPKIREALSQANSWFTDYLGQGSDMVKTISTGVWSAVKLIMNVIVGIIIAVYVLLQKEQMIARIRKLILAIFPRRHGGVAMEILKEANRILEGYLVGKLIDSLIIGILALAGMFVLGLPYKLLISVVICITNMIPFFGPYIGAVIGAFLILMVNPIQTIYFIIFVLVLQQLDGNFIGPKILGNSIGLDPVWIIIAVMVFGGCFGFAGMILGVPVFAWIYYIVKRFSEVALERKGMPISTEEYYRSRIPDVSVLTNRTERPSAVSASSGNAPSSESDLQPDKNEYLPEPDIRQDDNTLSRKSDLQHNGNV